MILVFAEHIGPRLQYTLREMSRRWMCEMDVTDDLDSFKKCQGVKINYSSRTDLASAFSIRPSGLLNENGVKNVEFPYILIDKIPCFFPLEEGDISFDVFSSIFFLLSRYEEYTCDKKDKHGRFPVECSVLFRANVLEKPVIEYQLKLLSEKVKRYFPERNPGKKTARIWMTFDIDNAWAFKNKSIFVRAGSAFRDLLKGDFTTIKLRRKVISGKTEDPYDTYSRWIPQLKNPEQLYRCFFLLGNRTKFDRSIRFDHPQLVKLIKEIEQQIPVGIHPSYASHQDSTVFHKEVARLQSIIEDPVRYSRFHYLKFSLPESYRNLENAGILEDHSMGHASHAGFRAGTCFPFKFYDLEQERISSLEIIPLTAMDGTLCEYMGMSPEAAMQLSKKLWDEVSLFGGELVFLWHNETLNDKGKWQGWYNVFLHQLRLSAIPG